MTYKILQIDHRLIFIELLMSLPQLADGLEMFVMHNRVLFGCTAVFAVFILNTLQLRK